MEKININPYLNHVILKIGSKLNVNQNVVGKSEASNSGFIWSSREPRLTLLPFCHFKRFLTVFSKLIQKILSCLFTLKILLYLNIVK